MVYPEQSPEKFEELVRRLSLSLKKMARSLNSSLRFIDEQDLTQEALIHLWKGYKSGELLEKTDGYILRGCYFHVKNYLRKLREKVGIVSLYTPIDEEGTMLQEIIPDTSPAPSELVEEELLIDRLRDNGLTERQREILKLCLQGYTTREIGKRLGISHVMVIKIKSRIRLKCR